ncbi:cocaine- and amphetamine-regulated transcript-like [Enoplosus armatus]|uniref:cocaine- and amphetamine-regulated transcript-like n=1 Tax=Enoplosus armatus TaxID=215367 RepID=UPI003993A6E9
MSPYKRRDGPLGGGRVSCGPAAPLCSSSPDPLPPAGTSALLLGPSTMDSSRMLRGLLFVGLLSVMCYGQASQEVSAEDFGVDKPEPAADRDLVEALEAVLGRMHNRISSTEKRGSIPLCGMGDRCAMKFGPRIGKLCDCGRGANCNSYLLKCI